jgi:hypothetical protein
MSLASERASRAQAADEPSPDVEVQPADDADGETYADTDPSALTDFHDALDAHGTWVDDPVYGTIWVPNADEVGSDFEPYVTSGRWVYDTDYVWVSDWVWGWVVFHYGRWAHLGAGGWGWVPGRRYAGGWVDWRVGGDQDPYVGWAPRPPRWIWRDGAPMTLLVRAHPLYVFCPRVEVFAPTIGARVVRGTTASLIVARTQPYVPAQPRVVAQPMVRALTPPVVRGPPPATLGIAGDRIVAPNPVDPNVARALAFARVSSAAALGAHAPAGRSWHAATVQAPPPQRARPAAPQAGGGRRH